MAEGILHEGKTLEQMEKEITCAVCQEHYTEPKVLPCLHYYCKECVRKLATRTASNQPFSCPECRKDTTLPEGGVEELKTAFFVNRYKSNYYALERVHGKVEVECEGCSDSGAKAEAFCRQCVAFICKKCVESHERLKVFSSHEVDSLEDLKQGRAREIAVKELKCFIHEEPLIIYCFDCNTLICRDCTVKVHRDHNFEFNKIAAPEMKASLQSNVKSLREISSSLSSGVKEIQTTKQQIEAQGNSVANIINTSFNQLQLILEERKQQLLQESAKKVQEKIDKLTVQEKNLSLAHAEVQSIVDYTERLVGHCSDNEVLSMHTEIKKRIEQVMEEQSQSGRSMEPVEEADMGVDVECVEALQQLCQTKAKICTQLAIDPAKCIVRGEGVESAMVNQSSLVTFTTNLEKYKTTNLEKYKTTIRQTKVAGQLKSLYNGSVVKCEVELSGPGEYRIQYTPTVRGRHELTVSVDGQQVAGSPFPVSVSIHPTQLGKPVKVWTGIKFPMFVTINSVGEIIATEFVGNIIKIDKEGRKIILVKNSKLTFTYLSSVVTSSNDLILCVSQYNNKILQCDKNGANVRVFRVQQRNGPGYHGVAVIGDEVMVCELNNSGTILVYDRELKYVRRIEQDGMGEFYDVSADQRGNLYATDFTNSYIRVFSNDGVFLRSFGCDDKGVKKLNCPFRVCVSCQFVYVTNNYGNNVSVFTTAGDYVTSFGQFGNKEGSFSTPHGICVDDDNFIYVADYGNDRVQCF